MKSYVLQSIIVGSERDAIGSFFRIIILICSPICLVCMILNGKGQHLQVGWREGPDVSGLLCSALRGPARLGGGATHLSLEYGEQRPGPDVFQFRLYSGNGDQLPFRPLAPDEYRSIRYDIHMQRLLKVIVLGLFPDQNAIIV